MLAMVSKLDYHVCMEHKKASVIIALITLGGYLLTVFSATKPIVNSLFVLFVFVATAGLLYWPIARKSVKSPIIQNLYFVAVFVSLLMWVGVTGWFFSPFFYLLYLIAIMLAFMYSTFTTLLFVVVLFGLFYTNIGTIDMTIDIMTMISLFSVVPLTYFLQREYLELKQAEKKVLILEEETEEIHSKVDALLLNKIVKMAVDLKQPINDMRQLAMLAAKKTSNLSTEKTLHKIIVLGRESLDQIEVFEEKVTGRKLLHTKSKK